MTRYLLPKRDTWGGICSWPQKPQKNGMLLDFLFTIFPLLVISWLRRGGMRDDQKLFLHSEEKYFSRSCFACGKTVDFLVIFCLNWSDRVSILVKKRLILESMNVITSLRFFYTFFLRGRPFHSIFRCNQPPENPWEEAGTSHGGGGDGGDLIPDARLHGKLVDHLRLDQRRVHVEDCGRKTLSETQNRGEKTLRSGFFEDQKLLNWKEKWYFEETQQHKQKKMKKYQNVKSK